MTKKQYVIGIDIGGTKMKSILYDGEKILSEDQLATPKDNLKNFTIILHTLIKTTQERARELKVKINGIGLSAAGVIDSSKKKMLRSPNIPIIDNTDMAELVRQKYEYPVLLDNDANCFVRAEVLKGACQKFSNVYGIIVSTGIGGGWWFNNDVYSGAHGGGGEPGDMIIDFNERIGLEKAYQKMVQNNPKNLAGEAFRGDVLAEKTFLEIGDYLGLAFANITNILDPEAIVVGGGVTESSELFFGRTKKIMKKYIHSPESAKKIKLYKTKLGINAGAIGAALLMAESK